jgi:hypothetical protein
MSFLVIYISIRLAKLVFIQWDIKRLLPAIEKYRARGTESGALAFQTPCPRPLSMEERNYVGQQRCPFLVVRNP